MDKDTNAIGMVRQMVADGQVSQEVAEKYFPELKESEDEMTRKQLLKHLREVASGKSLELSTTDYERWAAWVEKQGKQKPAFEMKTPEESLGIDSDTYNKIVDECIYGEQKPADKVEPKSAWSEEDENMLQSILDDYKSMLKEKRNWLKSLKDRVKPKQEWGEEDKGTKDWLIEYFKYRISNSNILEEKVNCKKALNLIESLHPQKQWKPSDEQMKALYDSIPENVMEISEREMLLNELYKDLKKLREE